MARLHGAEQVVAHAAAARQEMRGQLSLSRARQVANEASLAVRLMLLTAFCKRLLLPGPVPSSPAEVSIQGLSDMRGPVD